MAYGFYDHAWGVVMSGCLSAASSLDWSSLAFLLFVCIFVQFLRFNRTHHEQLPLLQETEGPTLPNYITPSFRDVHHALPPSRHFPPQLVVSTPTIERVRVNKTELSPSTHFHSITGFNRSVPPPRRSRVPRPPKAYRTLPSTPPPLQPSAPPSSPADTPSLRASTPIPPRSIIWTSQPLHHIEPYSPADSPLLRTPTVALVPTWTTRSLSQYGDQAQGQRYCVRDQGDIQDSLSADLQAHALLPGAVILPTIHHAHPIDRQQAESLVSARAGNQQAATLESPIRLRAGNLAVRPWEIEIDILPDRGKAGRRNLKRRVIGNPVEDDFASPAHPPTSPVPDERQEPFFRSPDTLSPSPRLILESPDADWFDDTEVDRDREQRCRRQRRFVEMQRLPAKKQRLLGEEAIKRGKKAMDEGRTRESLFWMLQAEIHHKEMERLNRLAAFAIFRGMLSTLCIPVLLRLLSAGMFVYLEKNKV